MTDTSSSGAPQWVIEQMSIPIVRQARHVAHSIEMIGALPGLLDSVVDGFLMSACRESWMLHVRLLAEFLSPSPTNLQHDFTCKSFDWEGATEEDGAFLKERKELSSTYLLHFGQPRVPESLCDLDPPVATHEDMIQTNRRLFEIVDDFIRHLSDQESPALSVFKTAITSAKIRTDEANNSSTGWCNQAYGRQGSVPAPGD